METLTAGQTLDHFTIIRSLGQGASSAAYMALDERDRRVVVLKCPNPVLLGNATAFQRFRREMAIGRRLKHPNIQQALDDGQTRSVAYLVLEYVEGENFRDYLTRKGSLDADQAASLARQILEGLDHAHGQGVYHRDVKPENVLITPDGQLKLIDFNSALLRGSQRLTWRWAGPTIGTPDYMAPEQAQGRRGDARTDVYSTGAVLYEMVTGRPPFVGDDMFELMNQHLTAPIEPPSHFNQALSRGLEGVILKALRKNPEERYQSAREFIAALDRYRELRLEDFQLGPERPMEAAHPDRLLALVAALLAAGFIGVSASIVGLTYLAGHH